MCPITAAGSRTFRVLGAPGRSIRALRSAWIVGGSQPSGSADSTQPSPLAASAARRRRASRATAATKSGLPDDASTIRSSPAGSSGPPSQRLDHRRGLLARRDGRGGASRVSASSGALSSTSVRARGAHDQRARDDVAGSCSASRRSCSVGSAQCRSSITSTTGRRARARSRAAAGAPEQISASGYVASCSGRSSTRRGRRPPTPASPASVSSFPARLPRRPRRRPPPPMPERLDDRPEGDPLAVGQAAAPKDERVADASPTSSSSRRVLPTPASPSTSTI